jgi:hypothetical protein
LAISFRTNGESCRYINPRQLVNTPAIHVSMQEFLRTGEFGSVRLGDSAASLRSTFGEPDELVEHRADSLRRPYGNMEISSSI